MAPAGAADALVAEPPTASAPAPATWAAKAHAAAGARAFGALAGLYARALPPIALLVAWLFGVYAAMGHTLPKVLCDDAVQSKEADAFYKCVRNTVPYSHRPAARAYFLLFWSVQEAWICLFIVVMGHAMFKRGFRRWHYVVALGLTAIVFAVMLLSPVLGFTLSSRDWVTVVLTVPLGFVVSVVVGFALARATGDPIDVVRWFFMNQLAGLCFILYQVYMPRLITRRSLDRSKFWHLLVTRVVAHPIIWMVITEIFTYTGRYIGEVPDLLHAVMFLWPVMNNALYGRFLLAQLDTGGSAVVVNVQIALFSVAMRVASRSSTGYAMRFLYSSRVAEAAEASRVTAQMRATKHWLSLMADVASTVCTAALYTFGSVSPDGLRAYDSATVWLSALYQTLTILVGHVALTAVDWKYHGFNHFAAWPASPRRLLGYMLLLMTVGGSKIAQDTIELFCPTVGVDGKLLLSYCNTPSLFDKM